MKNKPLALMVAVAVMAVTATHAIPITGGISFAGSYTVDTGDLNTANAFTAFPIVVVVSVAGSFADAGILPLDTLTMNPFNFTSFPAGGVAPLWETQGAVQASFDLDSPINVLQVGDDILGIKGLGTFYLQGYDPSPGNWVFSANQAGGTFSFSASNAATGAVPDGGLTLALLGGAMAALGFVRRKLMA
jgi:hypothetical protein